MQYYIAQITGYETAVCKRLVFLLELFPTQQAKRLIEDLLCSLLTPKSDLEMHPQRVFVRSSLWSLYIAMKEPNLDSSLLQPRTSRVELPL